jgi:superfamily II DNA or RNA helicase
MNHGLRHRPSTVAAKGIKMPLQLRPYQAQSIDALRHGFRNKHTRQVLCAATGAGKSRIAESMIQSAIDKGSRIMFVCERRVLVDQMSAHLDHAGIDHGVLMAGHWRFRPDRLVQVVSAQTLERMESIPAVDLVILDEVHALLRASILRLMDAQPTLRVIGLTATPFHPVLGKYFSSVVNVITMEELVKQGYLVPFRVFAAKEIDTSGLKVVAGEWKKDDLEKRGQQIVGDVVADYIRISHEVYGGYRKTICFSCGIAHGAELAQKFNEAGINAVQISSESDEDFRTEVLRDFARPDSDIKIVISVAILSRGFDQSDVDHVILARPLKKSFSEFVQMIGRGARIHDGKNFCTVQDNSGNWLRFAEEWETLYHDGVQELGQGQDAKAKKEPSLEDKAAAKCPRCGLMWAGGLVCLHCGHERTKRNEVVNVAGEMVELGTSKRIKKEAFTAEHKADFYGQLLGFAQARGYKPGYAYHAYIEKFGVGPSMAKPEPIPPGPEVLGWIKSQQIRKAKGAAK